MGLIKHTLPPTHASFQPLCQVNIYFLSNCQEKAILLRLCVSLPMLEICNMLAGI